MIFILNDFSGMYPKDFPTSMLILASTVALPMLLKTRSTFPEDLVMRSLVACWTSRPGHSEILPGNSSRNKRKKWLISAQCGKIMIGLKSCKTNRTQIRLILTIKEKFMPQIFIVYFQMWNGSTLVKKLIYWTSRD